MVELMVTLAIAAVLIGIAIPNMRDFVWNNRLATAANDLLRSVQQARSEAIKRQSGLVAVCATADPEAADNAITCSTGAFSGWFVFVDADSDGQHDSAEAVLSRGSAHSTVTVKSDNDGIVCFNQTGFSPVNCSGQSPTDNVVLCDSRGNTQVGTNSTARAVFITQTGRARVSRLYVDVGTALAAIGGTCP
jgi:type IV fimbrial biogenesis protein FimT